jgi:hypothetical protein
MIKNWTIVKYSTASDELVLLLTRAGRDDANEIRTVDTHIIWARTSTCVPGIEFA